jgi:uncharacterized membrane protein
MQKNRLAAFSDGVLAIIITILVLELRVPHGIDLTALELVLPVFLSYVLSFIIVGIYRNNHHHLFRSTKPVSGSILWASWCAGCTWPRRADSWKTAVSLSRTSPNVRVWATKV